MSGSAQFASAFELPAGARIALLAARFNGDIVERLLEGAREALRQHGIADDAIVEVRVPGAWELPLGAMALVGVEDIVAIVALGCVVRGDTRHYEHVADQCAAGLMQVQLESGVPVANGVLAVERIEDAQARAGGARGNKGAEVALAALEMATLLEAAE